jgi:hypothetical protein
MSGVPPLNRITTLLDSPHIKNRGHEKFAVTTEALSYAARFGEQIGEGMGMSNENRALLKAGEIVLRVVNTVYEKRELQDIVASLVPIKEACSDCSRLMQGISTGLIRPSASTEIANTIEQFISHGRQVSLDKAGNLKASPSSELASGEGSIEQKVYLFLRKFTEGTGDGSATVRHLLNAGYCLYFAYNVEQSFLGISHASGWIENPVKDVEKIPISPAEHPVDPALKEIVLKCLEVLEWRSWTTIPDEYQMDEALKTVRCPITKNPMRFAVKPKNAEGITYDRDAFEKWKTENPEKNPPWWPSWLTKSCAEEEMEEDMVVQSLIDRFLAQICTNELKLLVGSAEDDSSSQPQRTILRQKVFESFSSEEFERKSHAERDQILIKLSWYVENIYKLRMSEPFHPYIKQLNDDLADVQSKLIAIDSRL